MSVKREERWTKRMVDSGIYLFLLRNIAFITCKMIMSGN